MRVLPQSNKYTLFYTMNTTAVNESGSVFNGLYLDAFNLRISNFSSSVDDGSYWCQLTVNNTGLRPSDIGSLAFGALPVEDKCSLRRSELIHVEVPPVCAVYAENMTENNPVTDAAHPETTGGVIEPDSTRQTSRSTTASNSITNSSSAPTTATTKEVVEPKRASPSSLYIAIAVVLVAIALAVTTLLIIVFLVRKRRKRDRQSDKHKQKGAISTHTTLVYMVQSL